MKSTTQRVLKNRWKLNNPLLNNFTTTEEINTEIKRFTESNDNEQKSVYNLWDTGKAVIKGKFITISAYKKSRKLKRNNLMKQLRNWKNNNKRTRTKNSPRKK